MALDMVTEDVLVLVAVRVNVLHMLLSILCLKGRGREEGEREEGEREGERKINFKQNKMTRTQIIIRAQLFSTKK